jgi:hypothetical protein
MKKEILFRGKKISSPRDFVYGSYLFDKNQQHIIIDSKGIHHLVKHETIGQFIGSLDQSGNKIFEGDILYEEIEHIYDYVISVDDSLFRLYKNDMDIDNGVVIDWDKVVGNIHDNPNLLKESN